MREKEGERKRGQCAEGNGKMEIDVGSDDGQNSRLSHNEFESLGDEDLLDAISVFPKRDGSGEALRQDIGKIWSGLVMEGGGLNDPQGLLEH